MTNILLIGAPLSGNLGGPSLLIATRKVLSAFIPAAEFKLLVPCLEHDSKRAEGYAVKIIEGTFKRYMVAFLRCLLWALPNRLGLKISFLLNDSILREYQEADVIIDIYGISFTDFFPGWSQGVAQSLHLLIGMLFKKPVVKFTQDMGPFRKRSVRYIAKFCLNRLSLILARSVETKRYVEELGINRPIYVRPDTAFVLDPAPAGRIAEIMLREKLDKKPLVGIVASRQVDVRVCGTDINSHNKYTVTLAQIADYLIGKLNALVALIPNELWPYEGYNDIYVAKKVREAIENRSRVRLITDEYQAGELKGLIGECDLLITSRYHSAVAALSMCVPCLVIGWGHKYSQAMAMMGQEEFNFDFQTVSFNELQAKVDKLWQSRERVEAELAARMPFIRKSVFSGGKLVADILRASKV